MAVSPEEFLMRGDFRAEPFSPSVFLDLPPTPRPAGEGGVPAASSPDDMVLPFISRMLMEDDIDDKFFYQYPDHPALLQAQKPYAEILSDATNFDGTNSNGNSTPSPPSSSNALPDGVGACFLPAQDAAGERLQQSPAQLGKTAGANASFAGHSGAHSSTSPDLPSADGDHGALLSAVFSVQNGANMDMVNLAFLKGMEEAKKFLPTNNSLLVNLSRDSKVKEEEVDGTLMFQGIGNGRGRKNRHDWDYLEVETGRNSKLMMPEPEDSGEMVDKIVIDGYDLCLREMQELRIAMGSEAERNIRRGYRKSAQGRQSLDQVVDLHALLIQCAQAVATNDRRSAVELLRQIKQHSSPRGDATRRLAHCFAEGLEARLAGAGSQVYRSLMAKRTSVMENLKAYQLYMAACCFRMMAFEFANQTICKAVARKKKVHIVDYGVHYGFQWPALLRSLATREGGPPEVRITGIDLPQPGFRPAARTEETGRRLSDCAHRFGLPFKFHSIVAKWETVRVDDLNIEPDEVLIVNSIVHFGKLMDEGVGIDSLSPRDVVLGNIRKMRPDVFILFVANGSYSAPFFVTRFREALFHYSRLFDMLDATAPRDNDQRLLVERDLFGRGALNVIACEGLDRVERHETYKQWQLRNHRAGLRQLPLDPDIVMDVREKVKSQFHKDFVIDTDDQWLLEGWKGRLLYAMSTWVADDALSEF